MGIDVGSALVVGLPLYDVVESTGEYYEKYEDDLDRISPYYDADPEHCLLGYKICGTDYAYDELSSNFLEKITTAQVKFKNLTGKDAKIYVSPNVW